MHDTLILVKMHYADFMLSWTLYKDIQKINERADFEFNETEAKDCFPEERYLSKLKESCFD